MLSVTVVIDSREHEGYELPFPGHVRIHLRRSKSPTLVKVNTVVDRMPAGDYALLGFEDVVLVETKRSAREVEDNLLSSDYSRASSAFARLADRTRWPLLVCEFSQADLDGPVLDALAHEIALRNLNVWFAGPRAAKDARRRTADAVLRLMIARVDLEHPGLIRGEDSNGPSVRSRVDRNTIRQKHRVCRVRRGGLRTRS